MKEAVIQSKEKFRKFEEEVKSCEENVTKFEEERRRIEEETRRCEEGIAGLKEEIRRCEEDDIRSQEEIRKCEEDDIRSQNSGSDAKGESFYTVDRDWKSSGRSKHRTGGFVIAVEIAALLIYSQLGNVGGSWKSCIEVHPFPPNVLVERETPFEAFKAFFNNMHGGDPITGKLDRVLRKAGLRITENSPNDIMTNPDTTILGENQLSHTKVRGEDTSLQKPREEKGKKGETLPTVGEIPQSPSHARNRDELKFTRHFLLALLILSLFRSLAFATSKGGTNGIITKPDKTILGENQLSHTKAHGEDTSLEKPRQEKGRQGETLPTVGGTPRSSSHSKNNVKFKFTGHFYLALLILFLPESFVVAASIEDNSEQCPRQQFIELGRRGVVRCADQGNVSRVYWSNDANEVLIQYENGELAGPGYWNGELSLQPNGSLVINSVNIQHESTYRVRFLNSDLKISSYQVKVTVYVPPRPPCTVVEGCKLFHPCDLTIRRGEAITCKVNGVRPQVDLSMVVDSPIGIKTIPDTEIGEDGLFYTTIRGYIDVNKTTRGKNVTVICQALGPATIGFTSDVHITVITIGENCSPAATTISPEQDQPLTVSISVAVVFSLFSAVMSGVIIFVCMRDKRCSNIWSSVKMRIKIWV